MSKLSPILLATQKVHVQAMVRAATSSWDFSTKGRAGRPHWVTQINTLNTAYSLHCKFGPKVWLLILVPPPLSLSHSHRHVASVLDRRRLGP